jgi:hypothetical protein
LATKHYSQLTSFDGVKVDRQKTRLVEIDFKPSCRRERVKNSFQTKQDYSEHLHDDKSVINVLNNREVRHVVPLKGGREDTCVGCFFDDALKKINNNYEEERRQRVPLPDTSFAQETFT